MAGTFEVVNPATLEVIAEIADGGLIDARRAVDRASAAFPSWSRTEARARSEVLHRAFRLMLRDRGELAALISAENGKSLSDADGEVAYAAEFFRWFSEEAVRSEGDFAASPAGGTRTLVTHHPVGVAALVTPWNFPAAMVTRKLAPALAAGCTAVLKPAAETPLTALAVQRLLVEAGLPPGAVEIVNTTDAGAVVTSWLRDDRIRKVSFTGSTGVGKSLLHQAADRVLNASMELGGNAPVIITEDADLDLAVAGTMTAKFRNGGQACTAANRIYVHADIAARFTERFVAEVGRLVVGPASEGCDIGPLVSRAALARVTATVEAAVAGGARVAFQGRTPDHPGHFYPPTVLVDVAPSAELLRDELFAPVAPIVVWDDEAELMECVNSTEFGLAAYVFCGDLARALRLGGRVEAGMVGVNRGVVSDPSAPFGGMKQSGLGREGARAGLREFQETQYLSVHWPLD